MPAATAAADPDDEPPGTRPGAHGFLVAPNAEFSPLEPIANSSMFVFPSITSPASLSRVMTLASYGGRKPSSILEPAVVGTPAVQITSLIAAGTPVSGVPSPRASVSS